MSFFSKFKQSTAKSRLMKSAAKQVQSGLISEAVKEIFDFYQTDEAFLKILSTFNATQADIKEIILGLEFSGAGGTYKGHYVPVSAVLFHDTLAYLLRTERGQVEKKKAYYEVMNYFQTGGIVFEPEHALH